LAAATRVILEAWLRLVRQFALVNGFSNRFYCWGGEDDDFRHRYVNETFYNQKVVNLTRQQINQLNLLSAYV